MRFQGLVAVAVLSGALAVSPARAQSADRSALGSISFPTSASGAAQAAFLTGVKALHNFEFDIAAEQFRAAQKAAPDFALAYWGEAMSHNHPLWAQQDLPAARRVLQRLAPTAAARLAKAPAGKERDLLQALEILYGGGDKYQRDVAYSAVMKDLHARYAGDDEIATLYALSLLGLARPGQDNLRNAMQAAAIAQDIFRRNPQHPGAAHFIIHAFDDPDHAILALPAARAYAAIAPSAAHALHMPSHIFVQLGLWDDVIRSNDIAYKAAVALAIEKDLPRGREDFHTLSWLQYAYLQKGQFAEAERALGEAKTVADRDRSPAVANGYAAMKARQIVESGKWEVLAASSRALDQTAGAEGYGGNAAWVFASGYSAAKLGDLPAAEAARQRLAALRAEAEGRGNGYGARPVAVMEKEIAALVAAAKSDAAVADTLFKEAVALELALDAPSGPPEPIKPSFEMYAEFLAAAGRTADAAAQFQQALLRMPNRRASVEGLRRAAPPAATAGGQ